MKKIYIYSIVCLIGFLSFTFLTSLTNEQTGDVEILPCRYTGDYDDYCSPSSGYTRYACVHNNKTHDCIRK